MNRLTRQQVEHNTGSRNGWEAFASHRARVTELLRRAAPHPPGRLCVLGAGNCKD